MVSDYFRFLFSLEGEQIKKTLVHDLESYLEDEAKKIKIFPLAIPPTVEDHLIPLKFFDQHLKIYADASGKKLESALHDIEDNQRLLSSFLKYCYYKENNLKRHDA